MTDIFAQYKKVARFNKWRVPCTHCKSSMLLSLEKMLQAGSNGLKNYACRKCLLTINADYRRRLTDYEELGSYEQLADLRCRADIEAHCNELDAQLSGVNYNEQYSCFY